MFWVDPQVILIHNHQFFYLEILRIVSFNHRSSSRESEFKKGLIQPTLISLFLRINGLQRIFVRKISPNQRNDIRKSTKSIQFMSGETKPLCAKNFPLKLRHANWRVEDFFFPIYPGPSASCPRPWLVAPPRCSRRWRRLVVGWFTHHFSRAKRWRSGVQPPKKQVPKGKKGGISGIDPSFSVAVAIKVVNFYDLSWEIWIPSWNFCFRGVRLSRYYRN